jgi:GNAT superfamily N-acetyltransferase
MTISILPADPSDPPKLVPLYISAFLRYPAEAIAIGPDPMSLATIAAVAQRHQHAWEIHASQGHPLPVGIKAVHTDPSTGATEIVGYANWFLFKHPLLVGEEKQTRAPDCLMLADWVTDAKQRERLLSLQVPIMEARERHLGGRPHGLLYWLCVDDKWRGKGIGKKLVQWGLDKCQELGIPAYLEASDMGFPLYKKLGFEVLEELDEKGAKLPVMLWTPKKK